MQHMINSYKYIIVGFNAVLPVIIAYFFLNKGYKNDKKLIFSILHFFFLGSTNNP